MSSTDAKIVRPAAVRGPSSLRTAAPPLTAVLLFLVAVRLLLNVPAFIGAQVKAAVADSASVASPVRPNSTQFPDFWVRWDAGFYLGIARDGYQGDDSRLGFFPGYPLVVRLAALGQGAWIPWAGYLISNAAFILASLILWQQVEADFGPSIAWSTVVTYSLFPSALFFSAPYSESLFLLFSVLVYRLAARGRFIQAAVCVLAASVTRLSGGLLVIIPLLEAWRRRPAHSDSEFRFWLRLVVIIALPVAAFACLALFMWQSAGSPLAYTNTQAEVFKRTIAWPWQGVADTLRVILVGFGGFETNWFMRVVSAADLACALLFIAASIGAIRLMRPSLVVYQAAAMLFLLASHGPYTLGLYAMQRYVLILFPGFIVLGYWLHRLPKAIRVSVWVLSAALMFFLTGWFTNGRWVA